MDKKMNLETIQNNLRLLAFGMFFGFIGGLIYVVGFIGAVVESYITFALALFAACICWLIGLVFNIMFVFKMLKGN